MSSEKKGLGTMPMAGRQDVSFILQGGAPSSAYEIQQIPINIIDESDQLRLRQPPYPDVPKLADEIRRFGQTTPLFVRPKGDRFELISGYRRLSALRLIDAPSALARIYRTLEDQQAYDLAISENQDRESLTDLERAEICLRLQREGRTADDIAQRMGWTSDRQVYRHLKIAKEAPESIRRELQNRRLGMTVALALQEDGFAELSEASQGDALRTIIEAEMSVRDARACLARIKRATSPAQEAAGKGRETEEVFLHEYRNGAFAITAKIDPRKPMHLDKAIASLEAALKRAKSLKKKIDKQRETLGTGDFSASEDAPGEGLTSMSASESESPSEVHAVAEAS